MRNQLIELMQGNSANYESMMRDAEAAKQTQDNDLQERLRRRRQANEDKLAAKQAEIQDEFANMDIEQIYEQERAADAAQEQLVDEKEAAAAQAEEQAKAAGGTSSRDKGLAFLDAPKPDAQGGQLSAPDAHDY